MSDNKVVGALVGDETAAWGLQGDLEWRNAWPRVIAYAWMNDDNFKRAIESPVEVMNEVSRYTPPTGLYVRVRGVIDGVEMITAPFTETLNKEYSFNQDDVKKGVNGWEDLGQNLPTEVIMALPPRPDDESHKAFALADYDATGKTFPFTC